MNKEKIISVNIILEFGRTKMVISGFRILEVKMVQLFLVMDHIGDSLQAKKKC
jgi:hypothetical protein